jgi:multiple sugar transport system permease protein
VSAARRTRERTLWDTLGILPRLAVLIVALLVALLPIAWIVLTSFKPERQWISSPPVWIPSDWSFQSYRQMWRDGAGRALVNSLVVVVTSTMLAMVVGCLAAYSFSRFHTGGRHIVSWILSVKFIPPVVFAVPLLIMYTRYGLYDRWLGLIILYTTFQLPFVVWMMKGFFDEVPRELEESARVDGCSWLGTFWRFALPLSAPGLVATTVLTFVFGWSEFFVPLVFATQHNFPLTVQLGSYFSEAVGLQWGPQAALSVVGMFPMLVAAFAIQKFLIRGMTFGAVKG